MARVKGALNARKKHKRVLKLARGYYGSRSKQYRSAKAAVMRAQRFAYVGRRLKKRDFRKLWIARIKLAEVALDRKVLADIAVNDPAGFTSLVETAKAKLA